MVPEPQGALEDQTAGARLRDPDAGLPPPPAGPGRRHARQSRPAGPGTHPCSTLNFTSRARLTLQIVAHSVPLHTLVAELCPDPRSRGFEVHCSSDAIARGNIVGNESLFFQSSIMNVKRVFFL